MKEKPMTDLSKDVERLSVSWEITTLDEAMRVLHAIQQERNTLSARLAEAERTIHEMQAHVDHADAYHKAMEKAERERDKALARNAALVEEAAQLLPPYCQNYIRALATDAERDALARIRAEERERCADYLLSTIPKDAHPDSIVAWVLKDRAAAIRKGD